MPSAKALAALLAASCAAPFLPRDYAIGLREQPGRLANGMRLVVLPDHSSPVVEVDVHFDVGSSADPPGRSGLAHLVEHLRFEERLDGPTGPSLAATLRQLTLYANASTSWDSTHYQALARKEELEALLALEEARLDAGCEAIPDWLLRREREVVRSELRMRDTAAGALLERLVLGDVYPGRHPYGHMPGGDEGDLDAIGRDDVCAFLADHYAPERATLVIAGDVDEASVGEAVARTLGQVKPRRAAPLAPIDAHLPPRRTAHDVDGDESSVIVAWPLPAGPSTTLVLPFLLARLTARASTINEQDDTEREITTRVLGGPRAPVLAFQVSVLDPGELDDAEGAIFRAAAHAEWHLDDSFDGVRARLVNELAFRVESLPARAERYARYRDLDADGGGLRGELERLRRLDAGDVRSAIAAILDEDKATVILLRARRGAGRHGEARLPAAAIDLPRDDAPVGGPRSAAPIELPATPSAIEDARRFTLANGLRVVLLPSAMPVPVVTGRLIIGVGAAEDPPTRRGLARATAIERTVGTPTPADLDEEVGPDATTFTARAVSPYERDVVADLARMARGSPAVDSFIDELQKAHARVGQRPRERLADAIDGAFAEAIYGPGHVYAAAFRRGLPDVGRITTADINAFARRHYGPKVATIIVTGVFDADRVEAAIRSQLGDWAGGPERPAPAVVASAPRPQAIGIGAGDDPLLEVRVGYPVPGGIDDGYAARLVLVEILDRRVASVRERLGAAYALTASYAPVSGPGVIRVSGSVDAARAPEALSALRAQIDAIRNADGFLDDFVRARSAVLARELYDGSDSLTRNQQLTRLARFDLPPSFGAGLAGRIAELTPKEVLELARRELDPEHEVLVCAGAPPALERALEATGRPWRFEALASATSR
jgi:zinc protease